MKNVASKYFGEWRRNENENVLCGDHLKKNKTLKMYKVFRWKQDIFPAIERLLDKKRALLKVISLAGLISQLASNCRWAHPWTISSASAFDYLIRQQKIGCQ
jgi:hypothetical protein